MFDVSKQSTIKYLCTVLINITMNLKLKPLPLNGNATLVFFCRRLTPFQEHRGLVLVSMNRIIHFLSTSRADHLYLQFFIANRL